MKNLKKKVCDFEGEETLHVLRPTNEMDVYPNAELNIARETASVFQLKRRWEKVPSLLDLHPDFQREFVWPSQKCCELIESILMGIPLPAFYVRENERGVYEVVDGKQRLTSLFNFIDGKFRLKNLSILPSYNGCSFTDLTLSEQNKIEDYTLSLNVIKAPTSDRVIFDLFDRVNRGGVKLNNQEMRNALYQGNSTKLINELSQYDGFIRATEGAAKSKHMKDRYLVLRFLAFYMLNRSLEVDSNTNSSMQYKSNMEDFLGGTMRFLNKLPEEDLLFVELNDVFRKTMDVACSVVLPMGGFRLPAAEGGNKRPINMAFFESFCYLISQSLSASHYLVESAYIELLKNDTYILSLTHSVDSITQVNKRYDCIRKYINPL